MNFLSLKIILLLIFISFITYLITKSTIKPIHITQIQKSYLTRFNTEYKADINSDGIQDFINFNDIECDREITGNKCNRSEEYIQVSVTDGKTNLKLADSEKLQNLNSPNPEITYKNLIGINYIFISGLDRGAHSSTMIVLRLESNKLIHVCRKSNQKGSECNYWSDAGVPYLADLNGDNIPEIIEEGHTYSNNNLNEINVRNFTEIKNNNFITADSKERYDYFLDLYKSNIRNNLVVISKYD